MTIERFGNDFALNLSKVSGLNNLKDNSNDGKQIVLNIGIGNSNTSEHWRVDKDGSPVKEICDKSGAKIKEIKYHVDEKTGKETIYSITKFEVEVDDEYGPCTVVKSFFDEDGDGYCDKNIIQKYSNGRLVNTETLIEENINSVKSRAHMAHEIENRKMTAHDSEMYIKGLKGL